MILQFRIVRSRSPALIPKYYPYHCLIVCDLRSWPNQLVLNVFPKPKPGRWIGRMSATDKFPRDRIDPRTIPESIPQKAIPQESERGLAAIINTIPTTAWTTRTDGYCDFLNQCWLEYTGMTAEKAQGWGWVEAIHPDDRRRLIEEWQSCLASGISVDTEARMRRFDNSYRWFLIRGSPLRDESGNILKWYGICTDIEDRKRGEEDLRARELSWRQIVDNIPGLSLIHI